MRERVRKKKSRKPGRSRNLFAQVGTCKDGVSLMSGLIGHCPYVCDCPREASPWSQTNTPVPGDRKALRGSRWKVKETRSPATTSHKLWGSTYVTAVWATEQLLHHLYPSVTTQKWMMQLTPGRNTQKMQSWICLSSGSTLKANHHTPFRENNTQLKDRFQEFPHILKPRDVSVLSRK